MTSQPLSDIFVEGLRILCILGDLPHERTEPQTILVNLKVRLSIERAAKSDDLADSMDYVALSEAMTKVAQAGKFHLVEALADAMAMEAIQHWPIIECITVRIEKLHCIPNAMRCGIEHTRWNPSVKHA